MKRILKVFMILLAMLSILPIVSTLAAAFMDLTQLNDGGLLLIPKRFSLDQFYQIVFFKSQFFEYFTNSIKVVGVIIFGQVFLGVISAYAFAKMKFPGKDLLFLAYILVILLPFQVTMVQNYLIFDEIRQLTGFEILNTHWALIFPGVFHSFGVFLLRQFIVGIPNEIIEAARIDGAGDFKIFFRIVLPTVKPAVYALIILTFIDYWNIVEQATAFIKDAELQPLSVFLESIYHGDFGVFYAGALLYIVPAVIIIYKGEKYLSEGLSLGEMK
ncbi:MAG: carbohydrate ABC transporter permease [Clostridiales bacterium]|nr:carbohydrate ABC transporter permease [Clostridiales bacterium]